MGYRALYYTGTSASSLSDLKNRSEKVTGVRTDFADFEGQELFYWPKKRRNMNQPDAFAADFL